MGYLMMEDRERTLAGLILSEAVSGTVKVECAVCGQHLDVTDIPALSGFLCPVCSSPMIRPLWVDMFRIDSPVVESDSVISQVNAVDLSLDRVVTLHILNPFYASSPERCRQFADIGRTLAVLNNPSIVTVFNIGSFGSLPYLVTPDLSGRTLQACLSKMKIVPLETACSWIAAIASGLQAALERGLFHGELNTTNVIIDGMTERPYLIHFGMYELMQDAGYMNINVFSAPETAKDGTVNEKSDIYSLGALFYYLLTGSNIPVDEDNGKMTVDYEWITGMVNDSIADLICRMVDPDPQERPSYPDVIASANARLQHIQYVRESLKRIATEK